MKYKLKYSPDSRDKLKELSRRITNSNGKEVSGLNVEDVSHELENAGQYRFLKRINRLIRSA